MKNRLTFLLPLAGAVLAVAAWASVSTDYDHHADFSRYHTYSWIGVKAGNSLWQDRIMADVDAQMAAKGMTKVASGGRQRFCIWAVDSAGYAANVLRRISRLGLAWLGRYGNGDDHSNPGEGGESHRGCLRWKQQTTSLARSSFRGAFVKSRQE